jgi:hypothetical protein
VIVGASVCTSVGTSDRTKTCVGITVKDVASDSTKMRVSDGPSAPVSTRVICVVAVRSTPARVWVWGVAAAVV